MTILFKSGVLVRRTVFYLSNNAKNSLMLQFVTAKTLEMLSVDGQRGLPSALMRLLLLNVVGSSPAFFAKPEGE